MNRVEHYTKINEILLKKYGYCSHGCDYGGLDYCDKIINMVTDALNNNFTIIEDNLITFFKTLFKYESGWHNYHGLCCLEENKQIEKLFNIIFEKMPNVFNKMNQSKILSTMLQHIRFDSCYKYLNTDPTYKVPQTHMTRFIQRLSSNYSENNKNDELAAFIIKNTEITCDNIIRLAGCHNYQITNYIASIIDKTDEYIGDVLLDNVIADLPYTRQIILSLLLKGMKIADIHINTVISYGTAEDMQFIFDLAKEQGELKLWSGQCKMLMTETDYMHDVIDDKNIIIKDKILKQLNEEYEMFTLKKKSVYTIEKMTCLIDNGYVLNEDDIKMSIANKLEIPQIERFGVVLDEKFLKLCQDNKFYPKYNFKCVSNEMYELQSLCSMKSVPKTRAHLKKYPDLKPNNVCMLNVCRIANNDKMLELLEGAGGVVDKECLVVYSDLTKDKFMKSLIDNFTKNNDVTIKK